MAARKSFLHVDERLFKGNSNPHTVGNRNHSIPKMQFI
jgi:hypothetical protein